MRTALFAKRNTKEILRDPLSFCFGLGFPLVLLLLLSIVNASIPPDANNTMFTIENLAPGLAIFGTVFMALFAGMLLSKDRTTSFLMRLFTSPMTAKDFISGYALPLLALTLPQAAITFLAASIWGFKITIYLIPAILVTTFTYLLFIALGLLAGNFSASLPHLLLVLAYTAVVFLLAIRLQKKNDRRQGISPPVRVQVM